MSPYRTDQHQRRRNRVLAAFTATLTLTTVVAAAPVAVPPAYAADTVACGPAAAIFAVNTAGQLLHYRVTAPSTATSVYQSPVVVGSAGWQNFGKVLAGPDHRLYGINSGGLVRYRWLGSANNWELVDGKQGWTISTNFTEYASGTLKNKITVDEIGDFYTVDATGRLKWHRFDETARTWTFVNRTLDTGWDQYDLITAAGPGVLYARKPDGTLHRYRFEPVSQRWIDRARKVGAGWSIHTLGVFSAGGDTLWGRKANGELYQYRLREDNWSWPVLRTQASLGWSGFLNVTATTNTCTLTVSHTPARPSTPVRSGTATAVLQVPPNGTALGTVEYAYTDAAGRLQHGRQNPDAFGSVVWTSVGGLVAYTGMPALAADASGRLRVLGHAENSDVRLLIQSQPQQPAWDPWRDLGGAMRSEPAVARLSDTSVAVFALDAAGALWVRRQDGTTGDLMAWRQLDTAGGFTGTPVVAALDNRAAAITVTHTDGTIRSATYQDGVLGAWTSLGGGGLTGDPSVVLLPGPRRMVFARHTDGTIRTQFQNADGGFPGTWTVVGDAGITPAGLPSAVVSPATGIVSVFVRATDGRVHHSSETALRSGEWRNWLLASSEQETYPVDPTAYTFTNSSGPVVAYVVRTAADAVRVYTMTEPTGLAARRAGGGTPTFAQVRITQPKR